MGSRHVGFSGCGVRASVVVVHGLSSYGSQTLERRLSSCGAGAQLLRGMWDLPGQGLEPVSLALAGRFLTTVPPGKPNAILLSSLKQGYVCDLSWVIVKYSTMALEMNHRKPPSTAPGL